jgi:PAS domain-containing protein
MSKRQQSSPSTYTTPSSYSFDIYQCKFYPQDAISIILAVISVFVCFIVGISSYYGVVQSDTTKALSQMQQLMKTTVTSLGSAMNSEFTKVLPLSSVVQYSTSLDYKSQFLPIMDSGYPTYVISLFYCDRVLASNKDTYTSTMKSKGGLYANFTMYSSEKPYDASTGLTNATEYYPVSLSDATTAYSKLISSNFDKKSQIAFLGWDVNTQANKAAIASVLKSLQPSVSNFEFVTNGTTNAQGISLYQNSSATLMIPVVNTLGLKGVFAATFSVDQILKGALVTLTQGLYVTIYDNSVSTNRGLIYSSMNYANNADILQTTASATLTISQNFTILNKQFNIVFSSTEDYIATLGGFSRWIGVFFACIGFPILEFLCLGLFLLLRFLRTLKERQTSRRAINALKDGHERTKGLLSRIAKQEAKSRATVDAVPDFVAILNSNGRILSTNRNFDKLFGYSESKLAEGLHITSAIPACTANILVEPKYNSEEEDVYIRAIATPNTGVDLDVRIVVKHLITSGLSKVGNTPREETAIVIPSTPTIFESLDSPDNLVEEDEVYAIIGRPVELEVMDKFDLRQKAL